MNIFCPICGSEQLLELIELKQMPVFCNTISSSKEEAINVPTGDISLKFCENCGHTFNSKFDFSKLDYNPKYENSLHFSKTFESYVDELTDYIVKEYELEGKTVIDIGCGKGDFLKFLKSKSNITAYGFDKSFSKDDSFVDINRDKTDGLTFINDFYSSKYSNIKADIFICRHVLEHISVPNEFLNEIANANKNRKFYALFEVPNSIWIFKDLGIWDIIYEHYSYFSSYSLEYLFAHLGFFVKKTYSAFNDQYLTIEASYGFNDGLQKKFDKTPDLEEIKSILKTFNYRSSKKIKFWQDKLKSLKEEDKKVFIWGGGSKGITFLNMFKEFSNIKNIIDVNPRKIGKYASGVGIEYISPHSLKQKNPDVIIIMNPIYEKEIVSILKNLELSPEVLLA